MLSQNGMTQYKWSHKSAEFQQTLCFWVGST